MDGSLSIQDSNILLVDGLLNGLNRKGAIQQVNRPFAYVKREIATA
jgi:hypothetical protein